MLDVKLRLHFIGEYNLFFEVLLMKLLEIILQMLPAEIV